MDDSPVKFLTLLVGLLCVTAVVVTQTTVGATGPMGPAGMTGAQGPSGPAGAVGSQGAQGPQGPQGSTGASGPQGSLGAQGPTGPQGPQGPTGAQGNQGNAGPTGPLSPDLLSGQTSVPTNVGGTLAFEEVVIDSAYTNGSMTLVSNNAVIARDGNYLVTGYISLLYGAPTVGTVAFGIQRFSPVSSPSTNIYLPYTQVSIAPPAGTPGDIARAATLTVSSIVALDVNDKIALVVNSPTLSLLYQAWLNVLQVTD